MSIRLLDTAVANSYKNATSKTEQLGVIVSAFGSQPVTARLEGTGAVLRRILTLPAISISDAEDPRIVLGSYTQDTPVSTGNIARWVLRNSTGTDIMVIDAGIGTGTISHVGEVKNLCTPSLTGVSLFPSSELPVSTGPTWLNGQPSNQWIDIPGTANPPGGLNINTYGDLTIRKSDSTLFSVAAGGHNDGSSNAAASVRINTDSPSWTLIKDSTYDRGPGLITDGTVYYSDGRPASRHTYHQTHYIESLNAVLLGGCRFGWGGNTPEGKGMDLFDLDIEDYLPRYTWPDIPDNTGYAVCQDGEGNLWTNLGHKFTVSTATWSKPGTGQLHRYPAVYNPERNKIFALQWENGEGDASNNYGLIALELDTSTGNSAGINFNTSSALNQLISDQPAYAAMEYCPVDGKYYFLHPNRLNTFYVITPNSTTVWDISTFTPEGDTPPAVSSSGSLCKRLLWVPELEGFVLQSNQNNNMKFMKRTL